MRGQFALMKKFFFLLISLLFAFNAAAQTNTPVVVIGKPKGAVPSTQINDILYIDALAMAKKLGGKGDFFSEHKQLRLKIGAYAALLTAGQKEMAVNGERKLMSYSAQEVRGKIYVPVNFFFSGALSKALERDISLEEDGKIYIEKKFNVLFDEKITGDDFALIKLSASKDFDISSTKKNAREVNALIKNAVLKRDEKLTFPSGSLISKAEVKQCKADVCLRALLNKKAQNYMFSKEEGALVFAAYQSAALPAPAPQSAPAPQKPEPPVIKPAAPATQIAPAPALTVAPRIHNNEKLRVVIDAGHGGKDPGAVRARLQEKTINLDVSKQVAALLKKKNIEVKMTRTDDTFLALHQRSKISNDFSADVFVSIHTNAAKRTAANGFSVYFRSEKATDADAEAAAALENEALQYEETHFSFADMLLRSLATNEHINESSKLAGYVRRKMAGTRWLGVKEQSSGAIKQANFYVLRGVDAPALLVEMAFISNSSDRKHLATKDFRKKMADAIANGILDYAKAEGYLQ